MLGSFFFFLFVFATAFCAESESLFGVATRRREKAPPLMPVFDGDGFGCFVAECCSIGDLGWAC